MACAWLYMAGFFAVGQAREHIERGNTLARCGDVVFRAFHGFDCHGRDLADIDFDPIDHFLWAAARFAVSEGMGPVFAPDRYLTDYFTEQAIQDVHILAHTDEDITFDLDNSGYGLRVESTVKMASADSATTCKMKRPK